MTNPACFDSSVKVFCIFALWLIVALTGCSTAGQRDDTVFLIDSELAASVVHVRGNERAEQLNRLVKPGTVVMWLNKAGTDIRILFPERKVTIACLNPVSFSIDAEGIFESKNLQPGAVASLCFIQPGLYRYVVESETAAHGIQAEGFQLEGTIVVE